MEHPVSTTFRLVSIFITSVPWQLTNTAACIHAYACISIWCTTQHISKLSRKASSFEFLFTLNTVTAVFIELIAVIIVIIDTCLNALGRFFTLLQIFHVCIGWQTTFRSILPRQNFRLSKTRYGGVCLKREWTTLRAFCIHYLPVRRSRLRGYDHLNRFSPGDRKSLLLNFGPPPLWRGLTTINIAFDLTAIEI